MNLTPHNASQTRNPAPKETDAVSVLLDTVMDKAKSLPDRLPGELSNAFAMLDPALSAFHEDMSRAAIQLAEAKRTGQNIETALWRFETAESMYQTRLYEVRKTALLKDIEDSDAAEAKKELLNLTMQQRMNENFNTLRQKRAEEKRRKEERSEGGFFFYFMLGVVLANMNAQRVAREMEASRLRTAFFNARTA